MPARRQTPIRYWTPQLQLYEDDVRVFEHPTIWAAFQICEGTTGTRQTTGKDYWRKLDSVLGHPRWIQQLDDWVSFCLGGVLVASAQYRQDLFLNVLWTRYSARGAEAGEVIARKLLLDAQMSEYYVAHDLVPADFCWMDDIARRDDLTRRHTLADDSIDESESESESESEYNDDSDMDWEDCSSSDDSMDDDYKPDDVVKGTPDLPNFVQDSHLPRVVAIPTKPSPLHVPKLHETPESALPFKWTSNMWSFFPTEGPINADQPRDKKLVVEDLVEMRRLGPSWYNSPHFQQALETSGFLDLVYRICQRGNLIETSHPDVQDSFRWHNWKTSYTEMVCRWTEPTITQEEYDASLPAVDPDFAFSMPEAEGLLQFISAHPRMQPWSYDPMAVFLFLSLECFKANCDTWLVPSLRKLEYPRVTGWNAEIVYRRIMALGVMNTPLEHQPFLSSLDPRLTVIIEETSRHRTLLNRVEQEAHRPPLPLLHQLPQVEPESSGDDSDSEYLPPLSGSQKRRQNRQASLKAKKLKATKNKGTGAQVKSKIIGKATSSSSSLASSSRLGGATQIHHKCPRCVGKPMKDQCVQIIYVQEHKRKDLIGAALTCADSNNRLKPKPPPKRRKASKVPTRRKPPAPLRYLHPYKDLHMTEVKHRRRVYERCGKDIVRFVWRRPHKPDMLVGGVRFEAMSRPTLCELILNHRQVKVRTIRRRAEMQRWAYGKMTGGGNRQPNGGSRDDGYGPYACHNGDTPDDIRALFRGAVDTDVLAEVGS
ncbi:hypothetical protein C8R43DRAFT_1133683 [Mycena crocata]|nr:hypothetical protein C8R43DRAFT_1133683 [Mycena crocata]